MQNISFEFNKYSDATVYATLIKTTLLELLVFLNNNYV